MSHFNRLRKWFSCLKNLSFHLYKRPFFTVLDVEAFERLLGPCMELMKRNIDDYEDQLVKIFGSKTNISDIRWTVCGTATLPSYCTKERDTFVQYIMYNEHKRTCTTCFWISSRVFRASSRGQQLFRMTVHLDVYQLRFVDDSYQVYTYDTHWTKL